MALVNDPWNIRLAMLGMVDGNGHPYSWSAIINGKYDAQTMAECGYPVIPAYLGAQPPRNLGIRGAHVTHVWCDDRTDTMRVAKAAYIPNAVARPEEVIGQVDAVIIATDIGHEHVDRARPFIEAGLPVFIDKPLTDRADHLRQFVDWHEAGKSIMSTSCMRYATEYRDALNGATDIGDLRLVTVTMAKTWERYGIHALEAVYPIAKAGGYERVSLSSTGDASVVHLTHCDGVQFVLSVVKDMVGPFGHMSLFGTAGRADAQFNNTFGAFKTQLEAFVHYLRTGESPVPFGETVEQMKIIIAGIRSRENNGAPVYLDEI